MTKWSKFWTLKMFQTVLHWLYQTKNLIKVTPRSDQSKPKTARKVTLMIDQSNPKHIWHSNSSYEITEIWNNLNGKIRLFPVKIVKYSKW